MKGIARSFGIAPDKTDYDTTTLLYGAAAPQCSAIFIPSGISVTGRNFYACNRDYYLASMSEFKGDERKPGEYDMLSRMLILELYRDEGFSSIGVSSIDVMGMHVDAMNCQGLSIATLEDDTFGLERTVTDLSRLSGLHQYQAIQMIMDTCSTIEQAKELILNNRITMSILPSHSIIMDSTGRSFIWERSAADGSDRFIEGPVDKPVLITNHSVHDYPTFDTFPEPSDNHYDTFNRFRRLQN